MTANAIPPTAIDPALRAALSARARPPRATAVAASLTFGWRALMKIKRVPEMLIHVIAIPIIFTLVFTYMFGGALAGSTGAYLQFLLPGTLVMTVLIVTTDTGIALNADFVRGISDRYRSMPIWPTAPIAGAMLGDVVRYSIASALVITLGLALGFRPASVAGTLAAVALLIFFALSLSWIWTTLGLLLRTQGATMNVGTVLLFLLTFASNIFVDPQTMPSWLATFVRVNPISHVVTAIRELMLGTAVSGEVLWVLVASLALTAVFGPLTMRLYRSKS